VDPTVGVFAHGGGLAVVEDGDGDVVAGLDEVAQGQGVPSEVDGAHDHAGERIDQPGRADPDAHDRRARRPHQLVEQGVDRRPRRPPVARRDRLFLRLDDPAAEVDHRSHEPVVREVDPDDVPRVGDEAQHDGGLAAERGADPDLAHEPLLDLVADDLGDGRAREGRAARDFRAADTVVLEQHPEHEVPVVLLGLLLSRLLHSRSPRSPRSAGSRLCAGLTKFS
jgi:hypothetical protein